MFFNFNLNEILTFPFKDEEARKHLLVGGSLDLVLLPFLLHLAAARKPGFGHSSNPDGAPDLL